MDGDRHVSNFIKNPRFFGEMASYDVTNFTHESLARGGPA